MAHTERKQANATRRASVKLGDRRIHGRAIHLPRRRETDIQSCYPAETFWIWIAERAVNISTSSERRRHCHAAAKYQSTNTANRHAHSKPPLPHCRNSCRTVRVHAR